MFPKNLRFWLFDTLSVKTIRHVRAVPTRKAKGTVATPGIETPRRDVQVSRST